jgi:hypothetical protein
MSSSKTPAETITGERLKQLHEKEELYTKLESQYNGLMQFIESLESDTSEGQRLRVDSSGSSARRARGFGGIPPMEDEMSDAKLKAEALKGRLEDVKAEIEDLRELLNVGNGQR